MPLQFILFTHDDVIFRSALDALDYFNTNDIDKNSLHSENSMLLTEKTIIGRIFPLEENFSNQENGNLKFNEVLYRIPKYILID